MSTEQREHANVRCYWCDIVRGREQIRFIDGKAICLPEVNTCRHEYYESTAPGR